MRYAESASILDHVEKVTKIILSCHHHPDSDTVGSALSLKHVLTKMGKDVTIICPDDVPEDLFFMEGASDIKKVEFEKFPFSDFDLFIVCDTSIWTRLFISKNFERPTIPVIVIDNHVSNEGYGDLNLLDFKTSSVCEMLYFIYEDWKVEMNQTLATYLLAGMIGDTGCFQYEVHPNTFHVAGKLIENGAELKTINYHLFNSKPLSLIKFWGVAISKLTVDPAGFVYVAIPYEEYKEYTHINGTRESAAALILAKIKETKFGFLLTEEAPNSCSVSFRSRTDANVSEIAKGLGGGGHPAASGVWFQNKSFEDSLNTTLEACRAALSKE